jgi:hypothetical protein
VLSIHQRRWQRSWHPRRLNAARLQAGPERGRAVQRAIDEQTRYLQAKIDALIAYEAKKQQAVL